MSVDAQHRPDTKWVYSSAKLYGWLTGLLIAAFGGLMCSVPVGTILGVPIVVAGLLLCLSFIVTMSATSVSRFVSMPLVVLALALLVLGRRLAPVEQIIESFYLGQDLIKDPGPGGALGIPLMLIGTVLVATVVPWIRKPERLRYVWSLISMVAIQTGATFLLIGAVLTAANTRWRDEPYWIWIAVPVLFGLGVGLRERQFNARWLWATILPGLTLPLIWFLLD